MNDKFEVDKAPPAAFELTSVPSKGVIYTETCDGRKDLKVGDEITKDELEKLKYDKLDTTCEANEKCQDTFTYKYLANWQGKSEEKTQVIEFENSKALSYELNNA